MVETFENALTPDDVAWFKTDFEKLINTDSIKRPCDINSSLEHYGARIDVIDQRHVFCPNEEGYQRMCEILFRHIPAELDRNKLNVYMAYQRQFLPHQLHIDDAKHGASLTYAKSMIVPLSENPNGIFKTMVWDKMFSSSRELQDYILAFIADRSQFPIVSNVSELYDVDHCWAGTPSLVDTMPLDGVYDYQLGSIGVFDRLHLHSSTNWFKYHLVDHKDIILLHVDMSETQDSLTA